MPPCIPPCLAPSLSPVPPLLNPLMSHFICFACSPLLPGLHVFEQLLCSHLEKPSYSPLSHQRSPISKTPHPVTPRAQGNKLPSGCPPTTRRPHVSTHYLSLILNQGIDAGQTIPPAVNRHNGLHGNKYSAAGARVAGMQVLCLRSAPATHPQALPLAPQ